ncbi:MAG TPA: transcriptional regulator NrdR [Actinomycetota bacterium]|nr:transcriptional regulator NrdR [Actinomycetota bacterium]
MLWPYAMRCPWCGVDEDRVVDSRAADGGGAIRRRRHCVACDRRFTTYERIEDIGLVLVKRDGTREPWDREKLEAGIRKSLTGRPVTNLQIDQMLDRIEARIRKKGPEVPSNVVGAAVLAAMQKIDDVGYLRYASVYKDFQAAGDFERELGLLLEKKEPAKRRRKG